MCIRDRILPSRYNPSNVNITIHIDRNMSLDSNLKEYTLSIVIRNFILKASMINPNTTFTELSHPPDLGNLLIIDGKSANIVKGRAKARPNPSKMCIRDSGLH